MKKHLRLMDFQSFFSSIFFSPWASITHRIPFKVEKKVIASMKYPNRNNNNYYAKQKKICLNYSASYSVSFVHIHLRAMLNCVYICPFHVVACVGCDLSARLV